MKYKSFVLVLALLVVSPGLYAQGKLYLQPYFGFYVGAYRGIDSVNSKQDIIQNNSFWGKDFNVGGNFSYIKNSLSLNLGLEKAFFSAGYKRIEPKVYPKVDQFTSISETQALACYIESSYEAFNWNVKMPRWLASPGERKYIIVSKFAPLLGFEQRFMTGTFVNDYVFRNVSIATSQGTYRGSSYYHSYSKTHSAMRAGLTWSFYNEEKRKFFITLLYKFAFKDAGYFRFHFFSNFAPAFDYQTATKGNGFCIYAGVPIKLASFKKHN